MKIFDYDSNDQDDLIDEINFNVTYQINESNPIVYQGHFGSATIALSYHVYCDENYYGPYCEVYCQTTHNDTGLYKCDKQGNLVFIGKLSNCSGNAWVIKQ